MSTSKVNEDAGKDELCGKASARMSGYRGTSSVVMRTRTSSSSSGTDSNSPG
jgi:hypothetical protein